MSSRTVVARLCDGTAIVGSQVSRCCPRKSCKCSCQGSTQQLSILSLNHVPGQVRVSPQPGRSHPVVKGQQIGSQCLVSHASSKEFEPVKSPRAGYTPPRLPENSHAHSTSSSWNKRLKTMCTRLDRKKRGCVQEDDSRVMNMKRAWRGTRKERSLWR